MTQTFTIVLRPTEPDRTVEVQAQADGRFAFRAAVTERDAAGEVVSTSFGDVYPDLMDAVREALAIDAEKDGFGADQALPYADLGPGETWGWQRFWRDQPVSECDDEEERVGWRRGWARAYALGWAGWDAVDTDFDPNPYPQFSGPWEAWADGFNDHAKQVGAAL